jgi:putative peptide zinc metalloprotease protein
VRRFRATSAAAVLILTLLGPVAGPAWSQGSPTPSPDSTSSGEASNGGNTIALAINTKDGSDVFKVAFAIKRAMGDVVDNVNAAVAFASCTDCNTVAISIQAVLILNDPSVVTPTNVAIAINQECTLCETLAYAYQVILTEEGPIKFTKEGRREIQAISHELRGMKHEGLSILEILARLDVLMDRFLLVMTEQIVEPGSGNQGDEGPSLSTSPSQSPSESPSRETTSPSPSPSASETPSSSMTPSPSPSA